MKNLLWMIVVAVAVAPLVATDVEAGPRARADKHARYQAQQRPWHGEYYHTPHGHPLPLVVPPTARMQSEWGWGVAQTEVNPIYHQFRRPYEGDQESADLYDLHPTPPWPSHTRQFGVYYVRGPWK